MADPRTGWHRHSNNLKVVDWQRSAGAVIAGGKGVQGGWMSIADPRPGLARERGDHYPVSYTHLDVYKRQLHVGAGCRRTLQVGQIRLA